MFLGFKSAAACLAGLLLAAPISSAVAEPMTTSATVNLRIGPGTHHRVVTTIPATARIDARDCAGWCRVRYRGLDGWVNVSYVRPLVVRSRPTSIVPVGYYVSPVGAVRFDVYLDGPSRRHYYRQNGRRVYVDARRITIVRPVRPKVVVQRGGPANHRRVHAEHRNGR